MTGVITARETEHEQCTVDRSSAARASLSVCRWHEAGSADRGDDEADADTAPGLVLAFHGSGRGARRDRSDPPPAPGHTAGSDTAGRRRPGDRYDRCDGVHGGGW